MKDELTEVVSQMEQQIHKLQQQRNERIAEEEKVMNAVGSKQTEIDKGTKKFRKLKLQINKLHQTLDQDYKIDQIIKLEDELRMKTKSLESIRNEATTLHGAARKTENKLNMMNRRNVNQILADQNAYDIIA